MYKPNDTWVVPLAAQVRCIPDASASVDRRKRLGAFLKSEHFWPVVHHGMYEPNDVAFYVALGHSSYFLVTFGNFW